MRVERRPLSPAERGVLQERLQPSRSGWGELFCFWLVLPSCCGGLAFAIGVFCIGAPLAWLLEREYSTSPFSWAGRGPGYGLLILALLILLAAWISTRLDDKRLRGRVRRDLTEGDAEVLRTRPTAAVILLPSEEGSRSDPATTIPSGTDAEESELANRDDEDDTDDEDGAAEEEEEIYGPNPLKAYLRIAPTEVLVLDDPDLTERRRAGFPHLDIEFSWGPRSRVLLGIADEGATLDDVVETTRDGLPGARSDSHGELLIYPEPQDTLLALLATEPNERRRLWEQGTTANTLTRRFPLRR